MLRYFSALGVSLFLLQAAQASETFNICNASYWVNCYPGNCIGEVTATEVLLIQLDKGYGSGSFNIQNYGLKYKAAVYVQPNNEHSGFDLQVMVAKDGTHDWKNLFISTRKDTETSLVTWDIDAVTSEKGSISMALKIGACNLFPSRR